MKISCAFEFPCDAPQIYAPRMDMRYVNKILLLLLVAKTQHKLHFDVQMLLFFTELGPSGTKMHRGTQ